MLENLCDARLSAGLTQQALADKLEKDADALLDTVSKLCECGDRSDINWLRKFLVGFDDRYCEIIGSKLAQYSDPT